MQVMTIDALTRFLAEEFPQVAADFVVEASDARGVTLRLCAAERHLRPGGTVSGPAMFALADVAVYLAVLARIGPVKLAVTTSAHVDFMRKPLAGIDLIARAELVKLGRSLAVGRVEMRSEGQDDLVAQASLTYAIPPGTAAPR